MRSKTIPVAFLVAALGCGGRAAEESDGGSAGLANPGGVGSANGVGIVNDPRSSAGGLEIGIVSPDDDAGIGGSGGASIGAGGDGAESPNVILACAPDNLSLLPPCPVPIVIGTACDSTTFRYCRQGAENVLCGTPGSCIAPSSDGGGYYD
jgi:hypothetical protein